MTIGQTTYSGNNFKKTKENGKPVWYWEDEIGSQCGNKRIWRYEVQDGDLVNENKGKCPDGRVYAEMKVFGTPTKKDKKKK